MQHTLWAHRRIPEIVWLQTIMVQVPIQNQLLWVPTESRSTAVKRAPRSASLAAAICCRRSCASWWRNSCRVWSRGNHDQWKIPYFNGKIYGFRLRFSQLNQSIDHEEAKVFWEDLPIFKTQIIPKSSKIHGFVACFGDSRPHWRTEKQELGSPVLRLRRFHLRPQCQWEFQDPKMEVLYHIRPYFLGIFPYIGLKNRPYIW
jgi:hypothetical protein